jgi:hypothetical protein
MEWLLQLGIFDDDDDEPTFVIMLIDQPITLDMLNDLLEAGAELYGRTPPAHAQFWDCEPHAG